MQCTPNPDGETQSCEIVVTANPIVVVGIIIITETSNAVYRGYRNTRDLILSIPDIFKNEDSTPDPKDLSKVKGNKKADEIAQEEGFDDAHDAKKGRGESEVDIYLDKEGNPWLWDGNNSSEPDPL